MKVGYVVKRYPKYSETFIVNEILAHEAAGLEVEIFALRPPNDAHFQDSIARVRAPVTYLQTGGGKADVMWASLEAAERCQPGALQQVGEAVGEEARDIGQAAELARHAVERGLTHLHAHFATSAASVARLASRFAQIPYTFTAHAKDIYHETVCEADLRRKLAQSSGVVTVSEFNLSFLREHYASDADCVRRIYNGMPLERFTYRSPVDRAPRIVAIGRLVEKKGFEDLVDACAILRKRDIEFECHLIGSGELRAKLEAHIGSQGLADCVKMTGPLPQSAVIEQIRSASALAAPCVLGADGNRDGLPTVLPEAMALGTPCVSTDVTGIPEILQHEQTGLMVEQRQPGMLADALDRLLRNPELRVRLAGGARRLVECDYDIQQNTRAIREMFAAASGESATVSR